MTEQQAVKWPSFSQK